MQAPEVVSSDPASFPWSVFHRRHPVLIEQVATAVPRPPGHRAALDALLAESTEGRLTAPERPWPWWRPEYEGRPWTDVPFLWAESWFYRRLLDAVDYFVPGPWHGVDPFGPTKAAELAGPAVDAELAAFDELAAGPPADRQAPLTLSALWGNRADLGFLAGGTAAEAGDSAVLVDESAAFWDLLDARRPAHVALIADNAGRELLPDLLLIDHLLTQGFAGGVALLLKPHPYYVSDATTADAIAALARLISAGSPRAAAAGERLAAAVRTGRLRLSTDEFFCSPLTYDRAPDGLFAGAGLVIAKGDLNYRRLVGDRHWPATTPFAELTGYFPAPLVALRTLKCDVAVGLPAPTIEALDATGRAWRTSGDHAVIQTRR